MYVVPHTKLGRKLTEPLWISTFQRARIMRHRRLGDDAVLAGNYDWLKEKIDLKFYCRLRLAHAAYSLIYC
jgi:hypothetical protein